MKKQVYVLIALLHIIAALFVAFVIDRENWFDTAFSLETANKLNTDGFNSIDFRNYDVHPPAYYYVLAGWEKLNVFGVSEYHWAQLLSIIFGVGFILFAVATINKVFGSSRAIFIGSFLAIASTYLHYSTEIRMYSLILFMSVMGIYGVVAGGRWRYLSLLVVFVLPNLHYLATFASMMIVAAYFVIRYEDVDVKRWLGWFVMIISAGILFALSYAIPQRMRVEATWLLSPTAISFPSALFYSMFTLQYDAVTSIVAGILFLIFIVSLVFFYVKVFRVLSHKGISREARIWIVFALSSIVPALFIIGDVLIIQVFGRFGLGGIAQLYHPRFFLCVLWMFAIAYVVWLLDVLKKQERLVKIGLILFALVMIGFYAQYTNHELDHLAAHTPCSSQHEYILHETPFSSIPYTVYAREHNCNWTNLVTTDITVRMSRSAGFDIIPPENVFWNNTFPDYEFLYARPPETNYIGSMLGNRTQTLIDIEGPVNASGYCTNCIALVRVSAKN